MADACAPVGAAAWFATRGLGSRDAVSQGTGASALPSVRRALVLPRRQALVALLGDGSDKAQLRQSHSAAPSSSGGRHAALQRDREAAGYAVAVSPRSDSLPLAHLAQQTMLRYFTSYLQLCSNLVHTQVSPSMSAHPPLASHGALVPSVSHMHSPCVASAHMFQDTTSVWRDRAHPPAHAVAHSRALGRGCPIHPQCSLVTKPLASLSVIRVQRLCPSLRRAHLQTAAAGVPAQRPTLAPAAS